MSQGFFKGPLSDSYALRPSNNSVNIEEVHHLFKPLIFNFPDQIFRWNPHINEGQLGCL